MSEENKKITTIGEQGEEVSMLIREIVTVNDKDYALLSIVEDDNEVKSDDDQKEIVVMRLNKIGDDYSFELIEDDDEFNFVVESISDDEQ